MLLVTLALWLILGFAVYGVICTAYGNTAQAKMKEAGCTQFTKIGMWDVYDCYTADGFHFVGNSAGMMIPAGN